MKAKSFVVPTIYVLLVFCVALIVYLSRESYIKYQNIEINDNINYVSSSILGRSIPVIDVEEVITGPYSEDLVKISRYFYNESDTQERKEASLVNYNGTYMPNTGVDYSYEKQFDVLSIYEGTVIDIREDELLGKIVEVRHNNEVISAYQGLSEISVKEGDLVVIGYKIGVSGTNKLNNSLGNHVHLEIYKNGELLDPLKCIGKKIGDI